MNWDEVFSKVGKYTRFGKDMLWWYKTGKNLYDTGKDVWDKYFYKTMPHHQFDDLPSNLNNIVKEYLRKNKNFYVC